MAATSDDRLIADIYGYFIRGRQLIIVEMLATASSDPEEPSYKAPGDTYTDSLMLEYTSVPDTSSMIDEDDDLPVDEIIGKAIVDYVKAEMTEDPAMKEYYMERFNNKVIRYCDGRVGGLRRVLGNRNML